MESASAKAQQSAETQGMINSHLKFFIDQFSERPGFERQTFENLLEDTNEDTVIRILAHFNENLKEGRQQLEAALASENREVVWKLTHKIAGSAELLGFKPFGDRSRELSKQIRANPIFENHADPISLYLKDLSELNSEIERFFPSLRTFL